MANGRVVVPAPAFTPSQYGLLSVARDMTGEFNTHWAAGITYQPLCAGTASTFDECLVVTGVGASPEPAAKTATFTSQRRGATPFTVISRKDCSAPTFWNDAPDEVAEALTEGEGWQVERAFWTGTIDSQVGISHPHLAANAALVVDLDTLQTAATVVTGNAVDIVQGLGLLEQALANCYQGQGVIHVPASLGSAMAAWGLIHIEGGRYVTENGNLVSLGRGYTGSSPAGASVTGTQWMYATGAVFYARSPLRAFSQVEGFDRASNTLDQLAERTYVVGWDCCHLAIPIDLTATVSGAAGGQVLGSVSVSNFPASYEIANDVGNPVPVTLPAGSTKVETITRFAVAGTRTVGAASFSYSVTVISANSAASPTLGGVALPVGFTASYSPRNADSLTGLSLVTVTGDDVIVTVIP